MIVPDTAHGTNPASAAMCGFTVISLPSNERGRVERCGDSQGARRGYRSLHDDESEHASDFLKSKSPRLRQPCTTPADLCTTMAPMPTPSWATRVPAIWASI